MMYALKNTDIMVAVNALSSGVIGVLVVFGLTGLCGFGEDGR